MNPIKMKIDGFLSYKDPCEIDFTGIDLACISGQNGAGKSSLLDAITWVVFGQARKRDDSIINLSCDEANVSMEFEYEANIYKIQRIKHRNKSTVVEFQIKTSNGDWKPLTEKTVRETEAKIKESLKLDFDTFINASFFLQGKADQFTQQKPSDRKRILSNILGLEDWEVYRETTVSQRKKQEGNIALMDGRLQEIRNELNEEDERKQKLSELKTLLETVSELRQKQELALTEVKKSATAFEEKRRDLASKENALSAERIGLDRIKAKKAERQEELIHLQGLLKNKRSILDQFENIKKSKEEIESLSEKADVYYQLKSKLQSILFDINTAKIRLEQDLSNLESQKRNADSCKDEFTSITQSLQTKQNEMHQLRLSVDELGDLKEDLDRAVNAEAAARAENPQLKKQMEELKQKIDELANSQTCPLCTQSINQHDHEALLNKLREEGTALGDKFRSNMKLIETTQTTVIDLRKKIAEINKNELVLREIEKAYDQLLNRKEAVLEILTLWDQEQKQQYEDIQRTLSSEEYCQDLRKELDLVGEEIKNCGYDEGLRERLEIVGEEFRNITAEMDNIRSAEAALLPLEREINTIEEQELSQNDRVEILNEEIEKLRTTIDAFSESSIDVKTAEKELIEIRDRENKLYLEVGAANQKVEILTTLAQKMEGLNSEREEIANKIESLKLLERAFGKNGVPALLIEQALPQIELKANELLEKLSGGTMSLRFVTQAAYKDDKRNDLRETLDIQISDQMGPRDYEMFSGGEAFRVNFAVRLALSEVLAQRAGARLQMLVIDEGFGSQDEMGRQRLIEAINAVRNSFEKIFVITHIESLKEAFPNRIEITKINGGSTITVC